MNSLKELSPRKVRERRSKETKGELFKKTHNGISRTLYRNMRNSGVIGTTASPTGDLVEYKLIRKERKKKIRRLKAEKRAKSTAYKKANSKKKGKVQSVKKKEG